MADPTMKEMIDMLSRKKEEPASERELDNYFRRERERERKKEWMHHGEVMDERRFLNEIDRMTAMDLWSQRHPDKKPSSWGLTKPIHPDVRYKQQALRASPELSGDALQEAVWNLKGSTIGQKLPEKKEGYALSEEGGSLVPYMRKGSLAAKQYQDYADAQEKYNLDMRDYEKRKQQAIEKWTMEGLKLKYDK